MRLLFKNLDFVRSQTIRGTPQGVLYTKHKEPGSNLLAEALPMYGSPH